MLNHANRLKPFFRPSSIALLVGLMMALPSLAAVAADNQSDNSIGANIGSKISGLLSMFTDISNATSKHILTENELDKLLKTQDDLIIAAKAERKAHPVTPAAPAETTKDDISSALSAMPTSLDDTVNKINTKEPKMHKIIVDHGFTTREYLVASMTLSSAAAAEKHKFSPFHTNPQNVDFVRKHQAKVDKFIQSAKEINGGDDDQ